MIELATTTLIWGFSFSFIGLFLAKDVDPYIAIFIRFLLAFLALTPFLKIQNLSKIFIYKILLIGGLQVGLMYIAFYNSFSYISVPEVILFTVMTPLYITLSHNFLRKKFSYKLLFPVSLAILGGAIVKWTTISDQFIIGFGLVQLANICFAIGQISYRETIRSLPGDSLEKKQSKHFFAFFFLGALLVSLPAMLLFANFERLPSSTTHLLVLLWLGLIASGVGYFLWSSGSCKVNAETLAVMNNAVIPIGVVISLLFGATIKNQLSFTIGSLVIFLAIYINNRINNYESDLSNKR